MADTADALIRMTGIKKVFYTDELETHALADVHFEIRKGEYVAISGPSGCGKTTLLSILGLLDTPTAGEYYINGTSAARLAPVDRARVRSERSMAGGAESGSDAGRDPQGPAYRRNPERGADWLIRKRER